MAKVGIVMGSDSDTSVMAQAAAFLEKMGIKYEIRIISAHRESDVSFEWANGARERGLSVVIMGTGKAAHLPGMCAALFSLPVVGIPMKTSNLDGVDSLYSTVQMPSGIPCAAVAISSGKNAGILTAKILATGDKALKEKLQASQKEMRGEVVGKDEKPRREGYQSFLKWEEPQWITEIPELTLRRAICS